MSTTRTAPEEELHLHPFEDEATLLEELDASRAIRKLTLYNLEISHGLAVSIGSFLDARLQAIRRSSAHKAFVLEVLGCTGCIDRVLESFASGLWTEEEDCCSSSSSVERQLVLQHTHWNHFDASVFAALGMALDRRIQASKPRDKVCLTLFQPVLSEAKLWVLAQGIQESRHLKELDFSSCCFTPLHVNGVTTILAEGFRRNQSLEKLSLEGCELDDNQIVCILEGFTGHPRLQSLNLANNKLREAGMRALATAFSNNATTTTMEQLPALDLNISQPILSSSSLRENNDDEGTLSHHQGLFSQEVLQFWNTSTSFLSRLAGLNLSNCHLNDDDLVSILSLLFPKKADGCTSFLERLDLSNNEFTDQGIQCLVQAIQTYRSDSGLRRWKTLQLKGNHQLTDIAFEKLALAMQSNVDLEEVQLSDYHPESCSTTTCKDSIHYWTVLNKGGRRVIHYTDLPLGVWPHVLERVHQRVDWSDSQRNETNAKINVLYHLVSRSALCCLQSPE